MTMTIPENTAAPDFGAEVAAEQVDYPRILYVCEHCQENAPEMCGRARDDIYVTPSGKWLCDECIDEEGVPVSDCVSPPALYPASTVARLQQEIQRLTERELQRAPHGACPSRPSFNPHTGEVHDDAVTSER